MGGFPELLEQDWSGWEGVPDLPEPDLLVMLREIRHTFWPDPFYAVGSDFPI